MKFQIKSALRRLGKFIWFFVIATVICVLSLRWIPPFTSALMIENRIASWFSAKPYSAHYEWVAIDRISPRVGLAVIASEDQRFVDHFGFDWKAIAKAVDHNEKSRRLRGASTISQQVAKNLFLWSSRSWFRKGFEVYFTLLIELLWSKERILEVYLNIVEFGEGVYGVEAASQKFFHKPARHLDADQAALLAAVLPNPHRYKVDVPSAYVRQRQAWILKQMQQLGGQEYLKEL